MKRRLVLASLFSLLVSVNCFADEAGKAEAIALVAKAKTYLETNGKTKLLEAVNTPNGEFHKGSLYVFVYDMTATILAHPVNAKLVGKNTYDLPDVDGKMYRHDIIALAKTKKSGWVDYKYKNPEGGKVESKTSYVQAAGDIILVAGIYKK